MNKFWALEITTSCRPTEIYVYSTREEAIEEINKKTKSPAIKTIDSLEHNDNGIYCLIAKYESNLYPYKEFTMYKVRTYYNYLPIECSLYEYE